MRPDQITECRSGDGRREQRVLSIRSAGVEVRAKDDATVIDGYGALFNNETVIGSWFRERILPGAFTDSIAQDDIRVAFNHSPNFILGRTSAKTATVTEDAKGLRYEVTPPLTRADVVESIKRGDITGSSFQFEVENPDDEEWDYSQTKQGKLPLRTIKRAKLWETGPVAWPAYENTTVSARAVAIVEEARAAIAAEQAKRPAAPTPVAADAPAPTADPAPTPAPVAATEPGDPHQVAAARYVSDLEAELARLEADL